MLESLKIKDFALIDDVFIEFSGGFNVITGQTGAGKSILIGALSMVLGEHVSRDMVRAGTDTCEVESVFDLAGDMQEIKNFLTQADMLSEDTLILRRKFQVKGASRCFVNDRSVTLSTFRELGDLILDIHSQNQHQAILKKTYQREVLDRFASNGPLYQKVNDLCKEIAAVQKEIKDITEASGSVKRDIDYIKSQMEEIEDAGLYENIENDLERDFNILNNSEQIINAVQAAYNCLYEQDGAVIEELQKSLNGIRELSGIDDRLREVSESIDRACCEVEASCEKLREYSTNLDFDPGRLEEIMALRSKIAQLKRKYSDDISGIIAKKDELSSRIADFENSDTMIAAAEKKFAALKKKFGSLIEKLSESRKKSAVRLSEDVSLKLEKLGMKDALLKVELAGCDPGPSGAEEIEFMMMTNPGQPFMKLSRIASGGEVSRIMLALKSVLAHSDNVPVLVFDEIDTGIGATIADVVGSEIKNLSQYHQVIAVSHLPQIAGYADRHIKVFKETDGTMTRSVITLLDGDDRLKEIARMFGGGEDNISVMHARKILKNSQQVSKKV